MLLNEEQIIELTKFSMTYYKLLPKTINKQFYIRLSDTDPNAILNYHHHKKEIVIGCLTRKTDYEAMIDEEAFKKLIIWANDMSSRFPVLIDFEEIPEWVIKTDTRYRDEIKKAIEQNQSCCESDLEQRFIDPQLYEKILRLY